MATLIGLSGKLYVKVGGVSAGGNYQELSNVKDVSSNLAIGESDTTTRANAGWRATDPTLNDLTIEIEMQVDDEDPLYNLMAGAAFTRQLLGIEYRIKENGPGVRANMKIFAFDENQPLEEAQTVSVTLKVARSNTPPERFTS